MVVVFMIKIRKIGIIGAGHVGSHCAFAMMLHGLCDEITLVDINEGKSVSQALDCMDMSCILPHRIRVKSGTVEELANMDIIIISVGTIDNVYKDRLQEMGLSLELIKSFVPDIMKYGFNGYFVVITNPVDVVTYFVQKLSGLPYNRVIGTGTSLDSARLRRILSCELDIDAKSIQGYMMGEHGDSQVGNFSNISLNGKKLFDLIEENPERYKDFDSENIERKVIESGWDIYQGKESTEFGIACMCSEIVRGIFHDEKKIMACSAYLDGEYGIHGIYAGVPVVLGKNGIEGILKLSLSENERKKLEISFETLKRYVHIGNKYF